MYGARVRAAAVEPYGFDVYRFADPRRLWTHPSTLMTWRGTDDLGDRTGSRVPTRPAHQYRGGRTAPGSAPTAVDGRVPTGADSGGRRRRGVQYTVSRWALWRALTRSGWCTSVRRASRWRRVRPAGRGCWRNWRRRSSRPRCTSNGQGRRPVDACGVHCVGCVSTGMCARCGCVGVAVTNGSGPCAESARRPPTARPSDWKRSRTPAWDRALVCNRRPAMARGQRDGGVSLRSGGTRAAAPEQGRSAIGYGSLAQRLRGRFFDGLGKRDAVEGE